MPVARVERSARALFAAVLHLYPAPYRDEYAREMTLVLVDRLRGEHTTVARVVVFVGAIAAIVADAPKQHALVLAQDVRLALRLIRREKWFATVAIGTVAIGIALSTAVFSVGKSYVLGLVVRHVSWVVGVGISLGLAGALTAALSMRGLLFGIEPWDPLSQAMTIGLLSAVAVAAAWIPARRAMRVDPAMVLRTE